MLRIELLPSRLHLLIVIVLHLIAVAGLWWVNLPVYFRIILAVVIFVDALYHTLIVMKKLNGCVKTLVISDQSVWVIRVDGQLIQCKVVQYYGTPFLKVINLVLTAQPETGSGSERNNWFSYGRFHSMENITVVILPDSASFAQRRRLAATLKFGKFSTDEVVAKN